MKFALVIEAVDKASRAVRAVGAAHRAAGATAAKAQDAAARSTAQAAAAQAAANTTAQASVALADRERRAIEAKTTATTRLGRACQQYGKIQDKIRRNSLKTAFAGGFGRIAGGLGGAIGRALQFSAIGAAGPAGAAALFLKPARQYSQLKTQLAGITRSATDADKAMQWIMARQMPPHGIMDLTAGFVALKKAGIDPTRGALAAAADAAAAQGKSIGDVISAMQDAFQGDYAALAAIGIRAEKQGRYISYVFKDADGRLKRLRAAGRDIGAQGAAMAEAMRRAGASASKIAGRSWDGMMARLADMLDRIRLKIMDNGLYAFIMSKINLVNQELDRFLATLEKWSADGRLEARIKQITDRVEKAFTIGWRVAMRFYGAARLLYGVLDRAATLLGGWQNLLTGLVGVPFIAFVMRIISGAAMLASGLGTLIQLGAPLVGVFNILASGLGLAAAGFIRLGIAMMATPVGQVVAGIAAIAAGACLIYKNWDKIGPYFAALWEGVKNITAAFRDWLENLFSWESIAGVFKTLEDRISGAFSAIVDRVKKAVAPITGVWNRMFGGEEKTQGAVRAIEAAEMANRATPAAPGARAPVSAGLAAGGAGGDITVSFAPAISIQGAEPSAVKKTVEDIYTRFRQELPRLMEEASRRKARLAY